MRKSFLRFCHKNIPFINQGKFLSFRMQMYVREYGTAGPFLVIMHGILGSSQNWHSIAKELARNRQVLVPDLRNHGRSPHGPHSIEAMADDLHRLFIDYEISTVDILGHSMGGLVAMSYALKYQQRLRRLVVEDIGLKVHYGQISSIVNTMQTIDPGTISSREEADSLLAEGIPEPGVRRFVLQNLKQNSDQRYSWQLNLANISAFLEQKIFRLNPDDQYPGPVLFLAGGQSGHKVPDQKRDILNHFPAATFEVIEQAGHWVHFDAPDEFKQSINRYLDVETD